MPIKQKRKARRKHSVKGTLQVQELSKAGTSLNLKIYANKVKLGELEIGRGSLFWKGRKRKRRKRISWSSFAEKMDELSYGS